MKILYFDCFAGISGDMALGAFIDMGIDKLALESELKKLGVDGWSLSTSGDSRGGVRGTLADVKCHVHNHQEHSTHHHHSHTHEHHHEHNSWKDIKSLILNSTISDGAKDIAVKIFSRLAEAEAKVHGKEVEEVTFHEVGAVDSIVDIVGCAICINMLKPDVIAASTVELGSGTVRCAHGVMPVPAPATAKLAETFRSKIGGAPHECTTPTGAAIIAALSNTDIQAVPPGKITASGIGIGHRDCRELPNFLRILTIETESDNDSEEIVEISANIDDMTPEDLGFAQSKIFEAGAIDVWVQNILMKKNRSAFMLCALSKPGSAKEVRDAFLAHTSTLGVRSRAVKRHFLPRKFEIFNSSLGKVKIKISEFCGKEKLKIEYGDLEKIAIENKVPIGAAARKIYAEFQNSKA